MRREEPTLVNRPQIKRGELNTWTNDRVKGLIRTGNCSMTSYIRHTDRLAMLGNRDDRDAGSKRVDEDCIHRPDALLDG